MNQQMIVYCDCGGRMAFKMKEDGGVKFPPTLMCTKEGCDKTKAKAPPRIKEVKKKPKVKQRRLAADLSRIT